jgi:hypothetical protein
VQLHDGAADRQAHSHTLRLGGEEGLVQSRGDLSGKADAGIVDADLGRNVLGLRRPYSDLSRLAPPRRESRRWSAWTGSPCGAQLLADVRSGRVVLCHDGDPCDTDGVAGNDFCTFSVAVCIDQNDPNLPSCHPPTGLKKLGVPKLAQALPHVDGSACGSFVDPPVKIHSGKKSKSVQISANATAPKGTTPRGDRDTFVLECLPHTTP